LKEAEYSITPAKTYYKDKYKDFYKLGILVNSSPLR